MRLFDVVPELRIGAIVEVSGTSVRIELDGDLSELTRTYAGRVYSIGQIASIVKIHFGRRILFAYVRLLRMRSEMQLAAGVAPPPAEHDQRIMEADLFGEGLWHANTAQLDFSRGVTTYPLPIQGVYLMTQKEVQELYRSAEALRPDHENPLVDIGTYAGSEGAIARANINKMFGQHCAVLGSTGSGKSATVASLIHGLLKKQSSQKTPWRPRITIIDPHGEYARAFGKRAAVFRAYGATAEKEEGRQLVLPYWLMSAEEFRLLVSGKTEEEATSQHNIVYKALSHARMVQRGWIEKAREDWAEEKNGDLQPDEPRALPGKEELIKSFDRDLPVPFSLNEFESHIRNEQALSFRKSDGWGPVPPSEFDKKFRSILDKLSVLRGDKRLSFMMKEQDANDLSLEKIIAQFVGQFDSDDAQQDVRIVDISGLPNEIAGPLTALIARLLFQYKVWQTREERERDPVLLVCEEAHRYVPNRGLAEYEAAQTAIRRLAREGRKYGLGLMLVSQRPSDIEATVLSQCNSWVILRLSNSSDQEHVARFLPDSLAGLTKLLPSLIRREAIFVGEAAAIPARIVVNRLEDSELPNSNDIRFADGWSQPPIQEDAIKKVVARWRNES
jgi:DNA helicase HerA-like ATPase